MPFYPGSAADLLSRRAIIAADVGQVDTPLPSFVGKDTFFGGLGQSWPVDAPNPSFAILARQSLVARTAADVGQFDTPLPSFVGQDAFFGGVGQGPAYDYSNPSLGTTAARVWTARQSADAGQWNAPIPLLVGLVSLPAGAQSQDLPPTAVPRARDYSQAASFPLELIGQDQRNPGTQSTDLPSKAAARAREYGQTSSFPLELIAQDQFNPGQQLSGNTPAPAARARDYTWLQTFAIETLGPEQQFPVGEALFDLPPVAAARSRDYSFTASYFQGLIGQDTFPAGDQLSGNTPAATARARDYTFAASFPLELIGRDQLATGQQANDQQYRVSPRTFAIYDPGINAVLGLSVQVPVGQSSQDQQYRLTPRARDYSITAAFPLELVGKDAFNPGQQLSGNAPAGPQRASTLSETGSNQILDLVALPPVFPCGLSTAASELPPRAAARARDYSFSASAFGGLSGKDAFFGIGGPAYDWPNPSFARLVAAQQLFARLASEVGQWASPTPELIGRDKFFGAPGEVPAFDWTNPVRTIPRSFALYEPGVNATILLPVAVQAIPAGAQSTDLPPAPPARARDYTFLASFPLELRGKDQFNPGQSTGATELPPRAPQRANDYTFLASLPLYVFEQLPPGQSTAATELPPRAAARARDYTWLQSLKPYLIAQDAIYGQPGEVPAYDWPNPRGPQRLVDYTFLQTLAGPLVAAPPVFPMGAQVFDLPPAGTPRLAAAGYTQASATPFSLVARTRDIIHVVGVPTAKWIVGGRPLASRWRIGSPRQ